MGLLVFILSFIPGLFYLWIVHRQDKYDPEPKGWVAFTFFLGMLSTFPTVIVEQLVDTFIFPYSQGLTVADPVSVFAGSFLIIGPVEEMFKLWALVFVVVNAQVFDEPLDGLVYAGAASLGIASLENALYCVQLGSGVYLPRALMAVPAHVMFGGIWGFGLSYFRFRQPNVLGAIVFVLLFGFAALAHGAYDACLFSQSTLLLLAVGALLTFLLLLNIGFFWHYKQVSPYRWSLLPAGPRTMRRREVLTGRRRGLSVGWIAGGTGIFLGLVLVDVVIVASILSLHLGLGALAGFSSGEVSTLIVVFYVLVLLALMGIGFLLGGIVIGRLSSGSTVVEPAISAVLALSLLVILVPREVGIIGFVLLVLAAPAIFAIGCLGGWLGELWQRTAERKKAPATS